MYKGQKVVVVMPAYNAEKTIKRTHQEVIAEEIVDMVIVVDDHSRDLTPHIVAQLAKTELFTHEANRGYGANQKTCYRQAIAAGGDIVIMVHPDYQYTPRLIPAMAALIGNGLYPCVLGSRILGGYALKGGMPLWRYVANRFLTLVANLLMGAKLSEYHTGYRAFAADLLKTLPLEKLSDDFIFDNQILAAIIWRGHTIGEISCPTRYFEEASSINFIRSVKYGFGCLATAGQYFLSKRGWIKHSLFIDHIMKS